MTDYNFSVSQDIPQDINQSCDIVSRTFTTGTIVCDNTNGIYPFSMVGLKVLDIWAWPVTFCLITLIIFSYVRDMVKIITSAKTENLYEEEEDKKEE